jgi:hypothetical protein
MSVMDTLPYYTLPDPPRRVSAGTILARLVDGLGFRYRWATEGLTDKELRFRPGPDNMTLQELLMHILGLVTWADEHFGGEPRENVLSVSGIQELRYRTLRRIEVLSARLLRMSEAQILSKTGDTYPFWNMINGPLADALTHVGQVNAWRRLAGNPTPKASVFRGLPPVNGT